MQFAPTVVLIANKSGAQLQYPHPAPTGRNSLAQVAGLRKKNVQKFPNPAL